MEQSAFEKFKATITKDDRDWCIRSWVVKARQLNNLLLSNERKVFGQNFKHRNWNPESTDRGIDWILYLQNEYSFATTPTAKVVLSEMIEEYFGFALSDTVGKDGVVNRAFFKAMVEETLTNVIDMIGE